MARFTVGNGYRFKPGESGRWRAKHDEAAVAVLDATWRTFAADPEVAAVVDRVAQSIADPVERARRTLQELAPRLVRVVISAAHCDEVKMLPYVGSVRVRLDAALQALNRAGLKDTVAVEHDFSDRFKDALSAFYGPPGALEPAAPLELPPDPAEPARRRRDRKAP